MNRVRANQIAHKALQTRARYLGAKPSSPICPFNLAEALGFDLRFVKISSFEGMYVADEMLILIGAERPEGRKVFTCAHEIGHHILGHGTIIDEIMQSGSNKEIEKEADFFGGMLLMPESLVRRVAKDLKIDFSICDPKILYIATRYMGVSFLGLVTHLYFNLNLISSHNYSALKRTNVGVIKQRLAGQKAAGDVFVVGDWWKDKAIDMVVGDQLICGDQPLLEGGAIEIANHRGSSTRCFAIKPGLSKITASSGWTAFVRVSRKHYAGMNQYKFEEDVE